MNLPAQPRPERCLPLQGGPAWRTRNSVTLEGSLCPRWPREMPALTGGTGMTDALLRHPVRVSLLCAPQRDAYGMTDALLCHPGGVSLPPVLQSASGMTDAPPLIHPLTSTLLLPYRDIARTHKPHPRVDGYRIRIGVDAHRQIRAQRHRSAHQCRCIAPAAKAR